MKKPLLTKILYTLFFTVLSLCSFAQTSWTGATNTDWANTGNWTNGIPNTTLDVIIGDANFTNLANQPIINSTAACKSLTLGNAKNVTLTSNKLNLHISGDLLIYSGSTLSQKATTITLDGNFTNNGTYAGSSSTTTLWILSGVTQVISGSSTTTFQNLTVNSGSTDSLKVSINVVTNFFISGTFIPNQTAKVTAGNIFVYATGDIMINAATLAGNYSGTIFGNPGAIVEYSSSAINQTIDVTLFSSLKISGTSTKTLSVNVSMYGSTATDGIVYISGGTLDLGAFTLDRSTNGGGNFYISNGATLKIGGTGTLPANYLNYAFSGASTVEYYGSSQAVTPLTYGNLKLSGTGTKTSSATDFTIAGNLVLAGSVTYTPSSNLSITVHDSLASGTTFNPGSFSHTLGGNLVNNGTIASSLGTITFAGPGASISGTGVFNFNNITFIASLITAAAGSSLNLSGNLATTGAGMFTHNPGGSLTMTGTSKSISGLSIVLSNLTIQGSTTTSSNLTLTGNFISSAAFTASGNTIIMSGTAKTISGTGPIIFSQLSILGTISTAVDFTISNALDVSNVGSSFTASAGTATFTGSATLNGTVTLNSVTLNGTTLKLSTNANLGIAGTYTVSAGFLNTTTSFPNTVLFNGSSAQNIPATTFYNLTLSGSTKTATGAITTNGLFSINSGATFNAATFTHSLYYNLVNAGTFNANTSDVQFRGTRDVTITGATTFNTLTVNKTNMGNTITLINDIKGANIVMTSGEIKAGLDTLTITVNRSGSGIITGIIKHNHVFALNTDYAFEGPYNKINFNSQTGVTTVIETVTRGLIADYPYISAVYREYDFSVPAGTYNVNVYLHYDNSELAGNNKATMQFWGNNGGGWTQLGSTGYDAVNNDVYTNNITSLQKRYTLCSVNSVYRWTGKTNSSWNNAGNWSYIQGGNPQGIPGSADVVLLGDTAFTTQPVISQLDSAKTVLFYSTTATTLTLSSGGTLVTGGNILGFYTGNVNHTISIGNQNLVINGNLVLSDGTTNHTININAGSGSGNLTVGQSLTQSGGASLVLGSGNMNLFGDYNYTNGTFTAGSGSFTFNGDQTQIVAGVTYNNVVVNKVTGSATAGSGTPILTGNLTVTTGEFSFDVNTVVAGNVTIGSGTIMNAGNATLSVGGNWIPTGSFSAGSSSVNFNGTGAQAIGATIFNNFIINKASGTASLGANISMEGDLTLTTGSFDLGTFTANRTSPGGNFIVSAGANLILGGNNFPTLYTSFTLSNSSTVTYNGSIAQSVGGITYGNIVFSNGGGTIKTLAGLITVNGDLTINSGAILDANGYTINAYGNWINSGTYTSSLGAVLLSGTGKSVSGTAISFYRLTVYGSYTATASGITTTGPITVATGGSLVLGATPLTVSGDYLNSGTTTSSGTITFTGTQVQSIRVLNALQSTSTGVVNFNGTIAPILNSNTNTNFYTVNINNTSAGGINPSTDWTIAAALNVASGATWNGGAHVHNIYGSINNNGTITSTGTLNLIPFSAQTVKFGSFTSTGTVIFGGSVSPTFSGNPTSLFDVMISNTAGITPISAWTMNRNFTITTTSTFNASTFSHVVMGDFTSNGTLNGQTSTFTLNSDTGLITGSVNTNFNNLIISNLTTAGKIKAVSDFNVLSNFTNNGKLDVSLGTLRFTGSGNSIINGTSTTDTLSQIDINKTGNGTVTLAIDVKGIDNLDIISGTLDEGAFAVRQDTLSVGVGTIYVRSGSTFKIGGTNAMPAFSILNIDSLSTIEYNGSTQNINAFTYPIAYGNLVISSAGNKTLVGNLNVRNNFSLTNGTFIMGATQDTLGGNWSMTSGSLNAGTSTVTLNGAASQDISSTGSLYSLKVNKPSSGVTLSNNLNLLAAGTLTFAKGIITTGLFNISPVGTVNGASAINGYINGFEKLTYTSVPTNITKTFDVGDATNYTPLVFTVTASGTGNIIGSTTATDHPNLGTSTISSSNSVNRYWTLTNSGLTIASSTIIPTWVAADLDAGATPTATSFGVGTYAASTWSYPPTTNSRSNTSISVTTTTTSLGDIAIGSLGTQYTWTGATTTDWNTTTNWSLNAIPLVNTNVVIPTVGNGRYPIISSADAIANSITLTTAASSITVVGKTLQIYGTINNSGTFDASAGQIEMKGTVGQTIPANTFAGKLVSGFRISNISAAGVSLADTVAIKDSVSFGNVNNAVLNSNGYLTIKSTSTFTGRVADATNNGINNGNTINGNVTVERYIPVSNMRGYRFLAPSVNSTGSIHANWQENASSSINNPKPGYGTHITGTKTDQTNGFDGTQTSAKSFYTYNPTTDAFVNVANTNTLKLLAPTSYILFFRGNRAIDLTVSFANQGSSSTTLRATGTLVQGTSIVSNANTVGNGVSNGGFSLLSNPYAAPISWTSLYASHTSTIANFYTYYEPKINGGAYITVTNNGTKSNNTSNATIDIQSGQAFFIQASTAAAPTVTFLESYKTNINNRNVFTATAAPQLFYTSLFINDNLGRRNADGVVNVFGTSNNNAIDGNDADELENFAENIAINKLNHHLAIEQLSYPTSRPDTIRYYMSNMVQKNYDLEFATSNIDRSMAAQLVDNFTGVKTNLSFDTATIYPFTVTSAAASSASTRFYVVLNPVVTLPVTLTNFSGNKKDAGIELQWQTNRELSTDRYELERSNNGNDFIKIASVAANGNSTNLLQYNYFDGAPNSLINYYRLKILDKNGDFTYSKIIQVRLNEIAASINVYPNPVIGNTINLQLNNLDKGIYQIHLVNKLGQDIYTKYVDYVGGSATQSIHIDSKIAKGLYQLKIGQFSIPVMF